MYEENWLSNFMKSINRRFSIAPMMERIDLLYFSFISMDYRSAQSEGDTLETPGIELTACS